PDAASSVAMARPIPRDAPVTSATLPSSRTSIPVPSPLGVVTPSSAWLEAEGGDGSGASAAHARRVAPMTNRLAAETSPYLRQHADNPVDWYPWGPEAFAAARERDVPILLSVGYSAC